MMTITFLSGIIIGIGIGSFLYALLFDFGGGVKDMPVTIKKTGKGYQVRTPNGVHAKHTTLAKARSQERLLNAVEHGWKPTAKKRK